MLDDFFGQLLPFRLGIIEQGRLESPNSTPIPIHFMASVIDGWIKADFSVDHTGRHVSKVFPDESMGQWSLRTGDADPLPILIQTVQSSISERSDSSHGSIILDVASVNPDAEMAYCSFTVSGLPHFYLPRTFSETGTFRRAEYGRDKEEEFRPGPNFQAGGYRFDYVLEAATERPSCYRVSFDRVDMTSMRVAEAENVIKIWEGMLGFVSGVYRGADIVLGRDRRWMPVYGSWRNTSYQLPLDTQNWMSNIRALDFLEFAQMFVAYFLEEGDIDLLEWFAAASTILNYSDSSSVVTSYAVLERLTKNVLGKNRVTEPDIENMLRELCINSSIKDSNPRGCWDYPRDQGDTSKSLPADELGIRGLKAWRDKFSGHWDTSIQLVDRRCQLWYALLALTYLELWILYRIGYKGTFFPRVSYYAEAIPVPWAMKD